MSSTITPSAEQLELESSLQSFFSERAGTEYLKQRSAHPVASDPALWAALAELGLVSYFASADEDSRAGSQELGIIARQAGAALLGEPLVEAILGGPLFFYGGLDSAGQTLVAQHTKSSFAADLESGAALSLIATATFFSPAALEIRNKGPVVRVTGKLPFTVAAPVARYLLACVSSANQSELYLLDLAAGKEQRVVNTLLQSIDLTRAYYEVDLANVAALRLPSSALAQMRRFLFVALAEELSGLAAKAVAMTVEYVKTRKQFGVPVGTFQAVQHRIADMHAQAESMRALAAFGSWALHSSTEQAELTAAAALRYSTEHAAPIVEYAIQMHGGIGFTWEYELHLYLRRAKMIELLCAGDSKARDEALIAAVR